MIVNLFRSLFVLQLRFDLAQEIITFKFAFHQKLAYILEPSTAFIRLYLKQVEETEGDPPNLPDWFFSVEFFYPNCQCFQLLSQIYVAGAV